MKVRIIPDNTSGFILPKPGEKYIIQGKEFLSLKSPNWSCDRCVFNYEEQYKACDIFLCGLSKIYFIPTKVKL